MHNIESTDRSVGRNISRRSLLTTTGLVAAATIAGGAHPAAAQEANPATSRGTLDGRRKLGSLEVSSVGLGVQNMSRTYQTTVPSPSRR